MLHDRQLTVKQAGQFLAKLFTLVLDLKLLFIGGNIVEYRLDLICLLLDLLVELFTFRLLVGKLRFDLSLFFFKPPDLVLMLAVLLNRVPLPSGLLRLGNLNAVSLAYIPQHFPLTNPPAVICHFTFSEAHFFQSFRLCVTDFKTTLVMPNGDKVNV